MATIYLQVVQYYSFIIGTELEGIWVQEIAEDILNIYMLCLVNHIHELQDFYPLHGRNWYLKFFYLNNIQTPIIHVIFYLL